MNRILFYVLLGSIFAVPRADAEPTLLEHLTIFLTGTFNNAEQARGDQNFRNATVRITQVWSGDTGGPWLYLEQALTGAEQHPYRQIVYRLAARPDNSLKMHVFDLVNPIAATGAWRDPSRFTRLKPADLLPREMCTLVLHLQPDGSFKGATEGKECPSDLRGAAYASTEITVTNQMITLWERGYNTAGTQVWGSIHGGHIFKRVE